jgi:hypothetical protein
MRKLITLLLCLALSFQAGAAWGAPSDPCPMEGMTMAALVEFGGESDGTGGATFPDCCNDLATFLETGQVCKSGAECGHPLGSLLAHWASIPGLGAVNDMAPPRCSMAPSADVSTIWRPPTST